MNKSKLLLLASIALLPATQVSAQRLFQKVVGKVASVASKVGGAATGTKIFGSTDNLDQHSLACGYRSNLHSKDVGTMEVDLLGKGWKDGADQVMLVLTKDYNIQLNKLSSGGSITVDGEPAQFQDLGIYTAVIPHGNQPRRVEVKTANGNTSSFMIAPPQHQPKIVSINGQTSDKPTVDLTKDITIVLEDAGPADGSVLEVALTGSIMGLNTFYSLGQFKPGTTLTIPATLIAHSGISDGYKLNYKNSYLQVTRVEKAKATEVAGIYPELSYSTAAADGRFIKVTEKPQMADELTSKGSYNGWDWELKTPKASEGSPISRATKIGLLSVGCRGVSKASNQVTEENAFAKTTTTAWVNYTPSEAEAEMVNKQMADAVTATLMKVTGEKSITPADKISATKSFKKTDLGSEEAGGTKASWAFPYKADKISSYTAMLWSSFMPMSAKQNITEEADVNTVVRCVLDYSLELTGKKSLDFQLQPILQFSMIGARTRVGSSAYTTYASGTITGPSVSANGRRKSESALSDIDVSTMMATLEKALLELKAQQEKVPAYEMEWTALGL